MDFAVIGRISNYVKTKNLTFAAKHKIRTGQTLTNANGNLVTTGGTVATTFDKLRDAAKAGNDKAKQAKLRRIKQKLMTGKKLSDEELGFLRVNAPKLYKKAKAADDAREELKKELKQAKSKSEAREAMTRAMVKASTEAITELSALGQGGGSAPAGGGNAVMQAGGDAGVMNISGDAMTADSSGMTADGNANLPGAEAQTTVEGNQSAQSLANSNATPFDNHNAQQNSATQQNSDDDKDTPEDIMEKYLMIIRALEDEWAQFTNSKEYKDLPEQTIDAAKTVNKKTRRQIDAPNRKAFEAAEIYRRAMMFGNREQHAHI